MIELFNEGLGPDIAGDQVGLPVTRQRDGVRAVVGMKDGVAECREKMRH